MKKQLWMLWVLMISACATQNENHRHAEQALIGSWKGEAYNRDGDYKRWLHVKYANGNYVTSFDRYDKKGGQLQEQWVAYGQWWIKDGLLYQHEKEWMSDPIVYRYRVQKGGCIRYTLLHIHGDEEGDVDEGYTFTACPSKHK